jgi:RNA polymerase sigma-70 factor (ECF subfamily)
LADGVEQDDVQLLRRSASGDSRAFHTLVDRHADRLFRLAARLVGNAADAEDVLQETFTGAYRSMKRFEERASIKTWLTRILVTQAALWHRSKKKTQVLDDQTPHRSSDANAKLDVQAALQQLSAEHREVLVLREFESLSYDEIADVLNVPRGTVESRLHRARNELREKLKAYL